jgi:3-methyladenine DNA glycosylase AlkD
VAILKLWRAARFREERYASIRLISLKAHRECWSPELMPMLEEMIVTGAWWDYVDALAHVVGELLRAHPKQIRPVMRAWSALRARARGRAERAEPARSAQKHRLGLSG